MSGPDSVLIAVAVTVGMLVVFVLGYYVGWANGASKKTCSRCHGTGSVADTE